MQLPTLITLANGLKVLHLPFKGIDTASVSIVGRVGTDYESLDEIGVSHLLEHTLFDGSKKYPTSKELEALVEDAGGYSNGSTGRLDVEYFARVLKEDIELGFEFLSQVVLHPLLREEDILKEKSIVEQEAIKRFDDPIERFFVDMNRSMYPGQRRGEPGIGEVEHIRKIDVDTVRNYYAKHYLAPNFVLSVCSSLDEKKVFEYASEYFGEMKSGVQSPLPQWKKDPDNAFFVKRKKTLNQATVTISFFAPKLDDPDEYKVRYIAEVLGGSILSRLFQRLRIEKGYVYSVNTRYNRSWDSGTFTFTLKLAEENLKDALAIIKEEIALLQKELITEAEHERVQKQIVASLVFLSEKPMGRIDLYSNRTLIDLFPRRSHIDDLEGIKAVTRDEVRDVARRLFANNYKIGVISKTLTKEGVQSVW